MISIEHKHEIIKKHERGSGHCRRVNSQYIYHLYNFETGRPDHEHHAGQRDYHFFKENVEGE